MNQPANVVAYLFFVRIGFGWVFGSELAWGWSTGGDGVRLQYCDHVCANVVAAYHVGYQGAQTAVVDAGHEEGDPRTEDLGYNPFWLGLGLSACPRCLEKGGLLGC